MLRFLNKVDHDKGFIVRLLDTFSFKKHHTCLVFENLETNLGDLLGSNMVRGHEGIMRKSGLSLEFVKVIGFQILASLCLLGLPNISIIHCDLKLENIMLKRTGEAAIKIIDFGSSCFSNKKMFKYI